MREGPCIGSWVIVDGKGEDGIRKSSWGGNDGAVKGVEDCGNALKEV